MATPRAAKQAKAARKPTKVVKKPVRRAQQARRTAGERRTTSAIVTGSDYESARQLLSKYCYALDRGQFEAMSLLFHRDAAFAVSFEGGKKHVGRDTIEAWYGQFYQARPRQYRHPRHKLFEPYIIMSGDTATVSTYFDSDFLDSDGNVCILSGRYDDVLVKDQGQWFFKDRTISVLYRYSPGKGEEGMH